MSMREQKPDTDVQRGPDGDEYPKAEGWAKVDHPNATLFVRETNELGWYEAVFYGPNGLRRNHTLPSTTVERYIEEANANDTEQRLRDEAEQQRERQRKAERTALRW